MDKCTELQLQVRENAEEMQDYLKDLVSWEKEMKRKEEEIKKRTHDDPVLPPIRTAHSSSKKKKIKDKKSDAVKEKSGTSKELKKSQKSQRIPGYDYRAWDLFNVDDALKEADEQEKEENKKSSSEEEEQEESDDSENDMYEIEKKKQLALVEKDKGNQFFKKGNYDMAISCYTAGIEHDPDNALLPANRAMALIKKGQLGAAEIDCTQCLLLDPTYVKAYLRRGTARFGIRKYEEAKEDFSKVLELEPDNNQAKIELERLQKFLSKSKISVDSIENEKVESKITEVLGNSVEHSTMLESDSKAIKMSCQSADISNTPVKAESVSLSAKSEDRLQKLLKREDKDSCVIKAIQKPPHLRSQKPMKMIKIKDVSGITEYDAPAAIEEIDLPPVSSSVQKEIISVGNDGNGAAVTVLSVTEEQTGTSEDALERVSASPASTELSDCPSAGHTKKAETVTSISLAPPPLPPVPLTSYQFLGDWKKLKQYPELLYEYVKQFPPEKLPILFRQSIDTELFCGILQILSTKFVDNCEDVFLYLCNLRKVGRFKTLVMFLAEEEITALNRLFQFVRSSQKYSSEEIQNVEKDYNLS